jgi:histone chaperone ASF1
LPEDLEWKIIYVGSAESEEFDQVFNLIVRQRCGSGMIFFQHPAPTFKIVPDPAPDHVKLGQLQKNEG